MGKATSQDIAFMRSALLDQQQRASADWLVEEKGTYDVEVKGSQDSTAAPKESMAYRSTTQSRSSPMTIEERCTPTCHTQSISQDDTVSKCVSCDDEQGNRLMVNIGASIEEFWMSTHLLS